MKNRLLWGALFAILCLAAPSSSLALTFTANAAGVNGFTAVDKVVWKDSKGLDREVDFAKTYPNPIFPQIMGYVTRYVWQPDSAKQPIICDENISGVNTGVSQGMGIVGMHIDYSQDGGVNPYDGYYYSATTTKRDGFNFVQTPLYLGAHHLIFRVKYKQYTTLKKPGPDDRKAVDVTVDWMFADGLDYIVYAITIDSTANYVADGDPFRNDLRAPYTLFSEQSWRGSHDWSGVAGAPDGQAFANNKRFISYDMMNWTYGGSNVVPYAWEWLTPVNNRSDAEFGHIQTESYAQKPSGLAFNNGLDGAGIKMPLYGDGVVQGEPYGYQMNYYDNYASQRMTWDFPFGSIDGGYGSTPRYQNYSVIMMVDKFSNGGVSSVIQESEDAQTGALKVSAITGTLVTSGNEGSGNPTQKTFTPAGYNHVYRTWEINALNNAAELAFNTDLGYRNPTYVVRGVASNAVATMQVKLNNVLLTNNVDYWLSYDAATLKLYVTLLRTLSGNNTVRFASADADNDGVPDNVDNCKTVANSNQSNIDGDSMGDACDSDRDGDTIANVSDNCPDVSNQNQANIDGDLMGDVCDSDRDNDGRLNESDNCPNVSNPTQTDTDSDGLGDACDTPAISCTDRVKNGLETDVDCGGVTCPKCAKDKACKVNSDCSSNKCKGGKCKP